MANFVLESTITNHRSKELRLSNPPSPLDEVLNRLSRFTERMDQETYDQDTEMEDAYMPSAAAHLLPCTQESVAAQILDAMNNDINEEYQPLDTVDFNSEIETLSTLTRSPKSISHESRAATPLIDLVSSNKMTTNLSLPDSQSAESSTLRIEETFSPSSPAPALEANPHSLATIKRALAQIHLNKARAEIKQNAANEKAAWIETPAFSFNRGRIGTEEDAKTFEPRKDLKQQLMGFLYGDKTWSGQRLLDESS